MKTLLLLLSAVYGWADETSDLKAVERKWAARFYMDDWRVSLRLAENAELELHCGAPCVAASKFKLADKTGEILVLCQKCYTARQKDWIRSQGRTLKEDQRDSVVHELLHNIWANAEEEFAIAMLTKLFKP